MVANNPKMNGVKIRKGGRGQNNSARLVSFVVSLMLKVNTLKGYNYINIH